MRRLGLLGTVSLLACARPLPPTTTPAAPASPPEAVTLETYRGQKVPALCRAAPAALDALGRAALKTFERHLVDDVLAFPIPEPERYWELHDDGRINALEVGHLMHEYGVSDVLFAFPVPVELPPSTAHVRTTGTVADLEAVDHPVFYIEIRDVWMVRADGKTGFLLHYGAGPAGQPPKDVVWTWGTRGRLCAYRKPGGAWTTIPVGPIAVSSL